MIDNSEKTCGNRAFTLRGLRWAYLQMQWDASYCPCMYKHCHSSMHAYSTYIHDIHSHPYQHASPYIYVLLTFVHSWSFMLVLSFQTNPDSHSLDISWWAKCPAILGWVSMIQVSRITPRRQTRLGSFEHCNFLWFTHQSQRKLIRMHYDALTVATVTWHG